MEKWYQTPVHVLKLSIKFDMGSTNFHQAPFRMLQCLLEELFFVSFLSSLGNCYRILSASLTGIVLLSERIWIRTSKYDGKNSTSVNPFF